VLDAPHPDRALQGGTRIVRGLILVLAVKLAAILGFYLTSFSPAKRPDIEPATVEEHLLGPESKIQGSHHHD
jgi:hypothetical protein